MPRQSVHACNFTGALDVNTSIVKASDRVARSRTTVSDPQ